MYPALDKNGMTFFVVITISAILLSCGETEQDIKNPDNLQPRFSFGHEGEVLLASPLFMTTDGQSSIFISEYMHDRVYEFDLEGEFQRVIGRGGHGPGEFVNPKTLETDGEWLYVQDMGNMRLVLFNLGDGRSKIMNQDWPFAEFKIYEGKIYGFTPGPLLRMASEINEGFIRVYDEEGNMVNSFGDYLTMVEELPAGLSWPMLKVEDEVIHVVLKYFPIYRAYSTEGELLTELDLSEFPHLTSPEENYDEGIATPGGIQAEFVFRAMGVSGNRVFICRQGRTIVIDEYLFNDDSLTYKTTYTFGDLPEAYFVGDFFYHEESNSFYISEYNEIPMVTVYHIIEDR